MRATHSSQHTAPDSTLGSTCCCQTHEVWELPTPPIVANRSQQGDEVRELPAQPQQHPGPRPEGRLLRQPALEGLTRSAQMDSPRKVDRSKSDQLAAAVEAGGGGSFWERRGAAKGLSIYPNKLPERQAKSDAYANKLHKGDVLANLSSFTQVSRRGIKRSVSARGVQRYHSHFNRSCLPSAIKEDKVR
ncbi:histone-lysine N-methyltransferase ASHR2-like [Dorcoceras hygrometricum]|uniref:Histone-lysine N-methyltransferase ASHR2-like n=1 Tax=Dorcoceras hygrometricum TaxID=472368 RepID=A0A2Z7C743_9LAMI|nr:histone-lysine N-methyltransferase ASHR2-like [Dorcoceras hygrometricum]